MATAFEIILFQIYQISRLCCHWAFEQAISSVGYAQCHSPPPYIHIYMAWIFFVILEVSPRWCVSLRNCLSCPTSRLGAPTQACTEHWACAMVALRGMPIAFLLRIPKCRNCVLFLVMSPGFSTVSAIRSYSMGIYMNEWIYYIPVFIWFSEKVSFWLVCVVV